MFNKNQTLTHLFNTDDLTESEARQLRASVQCHEIENLKSGYHVIVIDVNTKALDSVAPFMKDEALQKWNQAQATVQVFNSNKRFYQSLKSVGSYEVMNFTIESVTGLPVDPHENPFADSIDFSFKGRKVHAARTWYEGDSVCLTFIPEKAKQGGQGVENDLQNLRAFCHAYVDFLKDALMQKSRANPAAKLQAPR